MRRKLLASAMAMAVTGASPAGAQTVGKIALRGYVPARALITLALATPAQQPLSRGLAAGSALIDISAKSTKLALAGLVNTPGAVSISLAADSAMDSATPQLIGADGAAIPYQIKLAGKEITFTDGEASLADITRDSHDKSSDLEIVSPDRIPADSSLSDHIVLVVTAR